MVGSNAKTRTAIFILAFVLSCLPVFLAMTPTASAETSLEDVFKKTIDDLLGKGKPQKPGQ